jgi:hypothetical protein
VCDARLQVQPGGFVRMRLIERRKVPPAAVRKLHVVIGPFSQNDRLKMAWQMR